MEKININSAESQLSVNLSGMEGVCVCVCVCRGLRTTVEPPNKGHLGTRASVLYSEVSFIRSLEMYYIAL